MSVARHPRPPELVNAPLEDIMQKYVGRFREKKTGLGRVRGRQDRGLQAGAAPFHRRRRIRQAHRSDHHPGEQFHPVDHVREPGQGNAAHTHEVEECFFVLQGFLDVFVEDESGKRLTTRLGPWECISCPAGVIHGYQNDSLGPVYFQVMLGRAKPETMGYADEDLYKRRDAHLKAV